ncbi:MAG: DUF2837 family protein [Vulcanimicrobiota bacterium]
MDFTIISDWRLVFIIVLSAIVSLLTSATVATRMAALITRRVAMAFTIYSIFFMITRFANLFYLPILGTYVDRAESSGDMSRLLMQIRFVIFGAAIGAALAWLLLPTLVEVYGRAISSLERHQSMVKVLILPFVKGTLLVLSPLEGLFRKIFHRDLRLFGITVADVKADKGFSPGGVLSLFRAPSNFGVSLLKLEGVPSGFLLFNIFATAVWTVGVLAAVYVSALHPEFKRTAVLLSGLVNAVAAILFSMVVDPKASLITDQAIAGTRPEKHVYITAIFLSLGNVLGSLLGQAMLMPGVKVIEWATLALARGPMGGSMLFVVIIATLVTMKASTTVAARIAAVITTRVATSIAIYNFFFLITRLAQQVYAPIIGSLVDVAIKRKEFGLLEGQIRWVIVGCSIGAFLGFIFIPTFVEIYRKAINGMERFGSLPRLLAVTCFSPAAWLSVIRCLRAPSFLGVRPGDINLIPKNFLIGNVVVISIHTIGVMAATYASALYPEFGRTATLLSSVVNGVATIVLSIIVDPISALITDEAVAGKRPLQHVKIMAIFLTIGTFLGTVLSQVIFLPAAEFIRFCSQILARFI